MKAKMLKQIRDLYEAGYDINEIIEETGFSKNLVSKAIEQIEEEEDPEDAAELNGIKKANQLKERELDMLEKKEFIESEKSKRQALKEFKKLVEGVHYHVEGSKWDQDSLNKTTSEIETQLEIVDEIFEFDHDQRQDNSIFEILTILKDEFSGLSKNDPDYSITITWSPEKLAMLQYALEIEQFDDTEFDTEDYNRQRAFGIFTRFIESLEDLSDSKVDNSDVEELRSKLNHTREAIIADIPGVDGEFEDEVNILGEIEKFLSELSIRIDESFWNEKRFTLPNDIQELIDQTAEPAEEE